MSVVLQWDGLKEFEESFGKIPDELLNEASPIVNRHANTAASLVREAYPIRSTGLHPTARRKKPWYPPGGLKSRVFVSTLRSQRGSAGAVVKSADPIAWLYDNGSQARHYVTVKGKVHETGQMWGKTPPTHLFVRTMIQQRRLMYQDLKALLVAKGFQVTGEA